MMTSTRFFLKILACRAIKCEEIGKDPPFSLIHLFHNPDIRAGVFVQNFRYMSL